MADRSGVAAVMVTYNSGLVAPRAVEALMSGTRKPDLVVLVDNASTESDYLEDIGARFPSVHIIRSATNEGFCAGNNRGLRHVPADLDVLLINPDAFVSTDFLERAVATLARHPDVGALGPTLLGAEVTTGRPTGLVDSAGIDQTWWGRFFDREMGEPDQGRRGQGLEDMTALCAAALLVRRRALDDVAKDGTAFDERFFMYKEDIDLAFRLRREGWRTVYCPSLTTLHCRGWHPDRKRTPRWARRRSLANEWRLWLGGWTPERSRWPALPYLLSKSVVVGLGR